MKQLLDFLPLIVFFIFYKLYDIYIASGALVTATGMVLVANYMFYRKLEKMPFFTFILVAVFGTLTLIFHNDEFIKWKVTVLYSIFAIALIYSQWFMKQPLIQTMLGKELQFPGLVWRRLNIAWAIFFLVCGIANIYVAFWFPQQFWVNFKVFGLGGLTLLFTILSGIYIWRQITQQEQK